MSLSSDDPPLISQYPQTGQQDAAGSILRPSGDTSKRLTSESINEALYLFIAATAGFFMNLLIICCIITCRHLRRMTSAFLLHGCVLDVIKCVYCVPFATSLLHDIKPNFCTMLGGSYVVIVTASGFNIVATVCCEAYTFSEHNVGGEGRGSLCCVIFGVVMVYIGSIIIHLGPTIIGGVFKFNEMIGNCIFKYGTIQSYVVHAMWIVIMTIAMIGAVYYLVFFYRHVQANSTHRLASLVRASIAVSRGNTTDQNIRKVIRDSLSRTRVLMMITGLYIICWYPLFILTLVDPHFTRPPKVYKFLTFIAWSNAALNPIVLMLFDRNINIFRKRFPCCRQMCRYVQCWKDDMEDEEPDIPLMMGAGLSSGLGSGIGAGLGAGPFGARVTGSTPAGSRTNTLTKSPKKTTESFPLSPAAVYQRVGCRLCQEGQSHSATHCNGGVGKDKNTASLVKRDTSVCELHTYTSM